MKELYTYKSIDLLCSKRWARPGISGGSDRLPALMQTAQADYRWQEENIGFKEVQRQP